MQDNDRTVSVSEAAAILGVSTDAVRKRLLRGTIQGEKVSGQWRVTLPDNAPGHGAPDQDGRPDASDTPSGRDPDGGALASAFAQLAVENARNAAAAAMWQERARNLETQLLALQPGDLPENGPVGSPVRDDSDATGTNTHVETERATQSRWARFLALFKSE